MWEKRRSIKFQSFILGIYIPKFMRHDTSQYVDKNGKHRLFLIGIFLCVNTGFPY